MLSELLSQKVYCPVDVLPVFPVLYKVTRLLSRMHSLRTWVRVQTRCKVVDEITHHYCDPIDQAYEQTIAF